MSILLIPAAKSPLIEVPLDVQTSFPRTQAKQ